jgi:5-methylcytosine-specific restriction endonuclease McrA
MCDISATIKKIVWERDSGRCIICGDRYAMPNAHFIPRSKGGLGIEKNVVTLCQSCHRAYDQSADRKCCKDIIRKYLKEQYIDWSEDELVYKK